MKLKPTRTQIAASPVLQSALLARAIESIVFPDDTLSHSEIQYCLDNDITIEELEIYSPVLSQEQIDAEVPVAWPDSSLKDSEGNIIRQLMWKEYTPVTEVTGGYVLRYRGSYHDSNSNVSNPTFSQVKTWVNRFSGFLTKSEVQNIRVTIE